MRIRQLIGDETKNATIGCTTWNHKMWHQDSHNGK
jgi:hypothetical protein